MKLYVFCVTENSAVEQASFGKPNPETQSLQSLPIQIPMLILTFLCILSNGASRDTTLSSYRPSMTIYNSYMECLTTPRDAHNDSMIFIKLRHILTLV